MCDLLSAEPAGECEGSILFFPEFVRIGGILLRFLYSGGVQSGILHDYLPDISASGAAGADACRMAAQSLLCGGNRRFWSVFCPSSERHVRYGCKIIALFELDI